jgi:outer membrane protein assembly factor BamE (lipoprotein component of BamABCDE complex)
MAYTGKVALAVGLVASLLGCAPEVSTHGYRFDEATLAKLEPGRTTQNEVNKLLGSPSAVATFSPRVWYYISQRTEHKSFYQDKVVEQKVVEITFDGNDVLQSIDRRNLADAREVALVDRETPTSGKELNVFEQFIGNIGRFNPQGEGANNTGSPIPGGNPTGGP